MIKTKGKTLPKVRGTSPALPKVEGAAVAKALGAQAMGMPGPKPQGPAALFELRQALAARLRSAGGRPSLGVNRRQKIPLDDADWDLLCKLAEMVAHDEIRPTPGQVASELLHKRLGDLRAEVRGERAALRSRQDRRVRDGVGAAVPMINKALEALTSDDFEVEVGPALQPALLRKRLAATKEVARLREALERGEVTDDELGDFVFQLIARFRAGERHPHETALAGIGVAVSERFTPFADEYLRLLAGFQLPELGVAPRVARVCVASRARRPRTERREVVVTAPPERIEVSPEVRLPPSRRQPQAVELRFNAEA